MTKKRRENTEDRREMSKSKIFALLDKGFTFSIWDLRH